jgi:hypothetical protein
MEYGRDARLGRAGRLYRRQAAELAEERVREAAALLTRFPESGRIGRIPRSREKAIGKTPYILWSSKGSPEKIWNQCSECALAFLRC